MIGILRVIFIYHILKVGVTDYMLWREKVIAYSLDTLVPQNKPATYGAQ